MLKFCIALFLSISVLTGCADAEQSDFNQTDGVQTEHRPVITGAATLIDAHLDELRGRRVGLVANPTARVNGTHLLDTLLTLEIEITALFAPEHGFRGDLPAGEEVSDGFDRETNLPVHSLYGRTRKPTPQMLESVDILLFDMQDVGVRFYTYISTLGLILEAAAENDVDVWVLDRPNPLGGEYVSGFMLEDEFKSFVGAFPIPVAHGMTIGELATMMIGEKWLNTEKTPNLRVISMQHWERKRIWPETGLKWRAPSPNLPHFSNALVYPGTCFIEGTTMSEGRGTSDPFMMVGAPDLMIPDSLLQNLMNRYPVLLEKVTFIPKTIPGFATNPKHEGQEVQGLRITPQTLNPIHLRPVEFGLELTRLMLRHSAKSQTNRFMYNLAGTRQIDDFLKSDEPPHYYWSDDIVRFQDIRKEYLLY
jgi:uncharacterized protein YbbC (DUF1343 family)